MKQLTILAVLAFSTAAYLSARVTPVNATAPKTAVARVWQGKVPKDKSDEYEKYLNEAGIKKFRDIKSNLGVQMFRRELKDATEFVVISYWPDREAIRAYAGDDIEKVRHLPKDKDYLIDPEDLVRHYDILVDDRNK